MAKQTINIGIAANDGTGDPLRTSFDKANDNFDEIYLAGPVGSNIKISSNSITSTDTNGDINIDPDGTGVVSVVGDLVVSGAIRGDSSSLLQIENDVEILGDYEITGALTVGTVTGNLVPTANVTYNLGNTTNRWNELYLAGNTIALGSITLKDSAGQLAIFASDGTTPATIAGNSVADDTIVNGTSSVSVASSANVTVTVNGSAEATFHAGGLNINDAIVATANITGGNLLTSGALVLGGTAVTATATELNVLDGIPGTLTATELGYVDGVTSAIQTQLDALPQTDGTNASGTWTINTSGYAATVSTASQPNITSVGTLDALTVTGNITSASGYFLGDGSLLANVTAVSSPAGNAAEVQYNQGGVATAGHQGFTYDQTTSTANIGKLIVGNITVTNGSTLEFNEVVLGNIGAPVSGSDAATKTYVDNALSSVFTVTDGTTNQTIADGDTLTFSGTTNEIEVAVSATDTVTIGLPNDIIVTSVSLASVTKTGSNAVGNIGSSSNYFNTVFSDTFEGTSTSAQYADLAEKYATDQEYEIGTVVVFGGEEEVTESHAPHDRKVAGVISGSPAYLMNSGADGQPVALTGRVPCKVRGPIDRGDLVVTSNLPGTGQKLDDAQYLPGMVLGKALESIEDDQVHTIEIVVGRL